MINDWKSVTAVKTPAKKPSERPKFSVNNKPSATYDKTSFPYKSKRHILSAGERRFYEKGLKPAIEDRYLILMKVRLTDIVKVPTKHWNATAGLKIRQRHVDFLLVTKRALSIVAAIELDDASHLSEERQVKDVHLNDVLYAAGIPLLRFPVYKRYDPAKIREIILRVLKNYLPHKSR